MTKEKDMLWDMLKLDYTLNKDLKGNELNYISLGGRDVDSVAFDIMNDLRYFINDIIKTKYSLTVSVVKLDYYYKVTSKFENKDMNILLYSVVSIDGLDKNSIKYCKSETEKRILKEIMYKQAERSF